MDNPSPYPHFFGFSQKPFDIEPDLDSLFLVKSQKEALISIIQGINERQGLILISGETGAGKTTLLRYLQAKLPKKVKTILISRVSVFFKEILKQITQELRLPLADENPVFLHSQLRTHLAEGLERRENLAIFVDDAQNLNWETFEELRLLSQMKEGGARLLQIVLAGRPELDAILSSKELNPLSRQIQIRLQIQPLLPEESRLFIEQRLQRAGRRSVDVFTPEAIDLIITQGGGIFRNIISLCDRAFRKGLDLQEKVIDVEILRKTLDDAEIPFLEAREEPAETTAADALIHRLFQNPPRIIKEDILTKALSYLRRHPSYIYAVGTFVLGLVLFFGWDFLSTPSPSRAPRIETTTSVAKEKAPVPAPQEKAETSARSVPKPPGEKAELAPSSPPKAEVPPPPVESKTEAKIEEKPAVKPAVRAVSKQPPKPSSKKELKAE